VRGFGGAESLRNIAMKIMYDGTDFHGWQIQPNGITVQETVENTLKKITGEDIKVTGCSRTDAGVHAADYVLNFFSDTKIPAEKLPYAFNNNFKSDSVSAIAAFDVDAEFNSRFSSIGKRYIYKIHNSGISNPFTGRFCWKFPYKLNIDEMQKASQYFVGEHDFSAFMAAGGSQKTTVRNVYKCTVERDPEWDTDIIVTVESNAFLYNMVRIITGTLAEVGCGRINAEDIPAIIESRERKNAGMTAPPEGLHLFKVFYDLKYKEICNDK